MPDKPTKQQTTRGKDPDDTETMDLEEWLAKEATKERRSKTMPNEWHPIGTAPKNRPFLVWVVDEHESKLYRAIFNRECVPEGHFIIATKRKGDPREKVREITNGRLWTATQWIELPTQPTTKKEQDDAE